MSESTEILGVIAALALAAMLVAPPPDHARVAARRLLRACNWPAAALGALALLALLWGALVTVSAENYFDPDHQLDAVVVQAAAGR
jgi:hypothetical protein